MTRPRKLAIDVALVVGCVFGLPDAARATLIAGSLVCTGAGRLIGGRSAERGERHAAEARHG